MNRLWVRFSIAITSVLIFAIVLTTLQILFGPWLYPFSDESLSDSNQSIPPLDADEVDYLIETLAAQEFEWLEVSIYEDSFFSVSGIGTMIQINNLEESLADLETFEGVYVFSDSFSLAGQVPAEEIETFIDDLPADEIFIFDEPLLVENLSLIDILELLYEQIWQAIITSVVLGIGLGIWLSRTLTSPLSRLTEAARAIGAKDLSRRVTVQGSKEVLELADTFNNMAAELEKGERLRRQMMTDVSHELRTPLTGLESNLRAALDNVHQLEEADLARLYSQTNHLIQLVNDLHKISLAEAGQLPLDIKRVNLSALIEQTTTMFSPLTEEKDITLTYHPAPKLQPIMVDELRLRQVLHNLLANAVRHTPHDGTITVTVTQDHALSQIKINDSGEGIAPHHIAHIFDRFYRIDSSRNRASGGTGLGLAIAKAIIEAHNGTLQATTHDNSGTTFTITLPLNNDLSG